MILLLGLCLILEAWNADIFTWLASDTGRAVIATLASIVAIAVIAVIVLEVVTTLVDRYLTQVDERGELVERSQRARTLLPLARNALRVVVGVIAALMILSEIGLDIAPVLAGVGVAGLAIGFGAQTLVKDIITGLFILLEDSVAVGDVATAGGHTGTVEAITIRTIRMRDLQGHVHTVPYSSVDTISNMTKEFSYYLIDMGVAYREDYDEVVAIMREVGAALQQDPQFGPNMLEPLEIMGLNSFGDSAVMVRARLKTKPLKQWATGREYNRRLKARLRRTRHRDPLPPHHDLLRRGQAGPRTRRPGGYRGCKGEHGRLRPTALCRWRRGGGGERDEAARAHAARADRRRTGRRRQRFGRRRARLARASIAVGIIPVAARRATRWVTVRDVTGEEGPAKRASSCGGIARSVDFDRPLTYIMPRNSNGTMPRTMPVSRSAASISPHAIRAFLDDDRIVGRDRRWGLRREPLSAARGDRGSRVRPSIYTVRGSAIRIISARKANGKEVREYEQNTRQD